MRLSVVVASTVTYPRSLVSGIPREARFLKAEFQWMLCYYVYAFNALRFAWVDLWKWTRISGLSHGRASSALRGGSIAF